MHTLFEGRDAEIKGFDGRSPAKSLDFYLLQRGKRGPTSRS